MAKKKKATEEVAKVDLSKKASPEDNVTKVNLDKPIENETKEEIKEDNPVDEGVVAEPDNAEPTKKQEEVQPEEQAQEETPVLEEITEEEVKEKTEELADEVVEAIEQAEETGKAIPDDILTKRQEAREKVNEI